MKYFTLCIALLGSQAAATLLRSDSCAAEDLKHRAMFQNRLAGDCEEMCKEVGAYPKKCTCPGFVQPDSTPGVMTWEELLAHMDNLVAWGKETLKGWTSQAASALQKKMVSHAKTAQGSISVSKACVAQDLKHRAQIQNKLASACEDMCKEIGAYPDCECPDFVQPDSTPGVVTWEELLEHMDNLVAWSVDLIKSWKGRASQIQLAASNSTVNGTKKVVSNKTGCSADVTSPTSYPLAETTPTHMIPQGGVVKFCGAGQLKRVMGSCPDAAAFDSASGDLFSNGGASECQNVDCTGSHTYCCMGYKCGSSGTAWAR